MSTLRIVLPHPRGPLQYLKPPEGRRFGTIANSSSWRSTTRFSRPIQLRRQIKIQSPSPSLISARCRPRSPAHLTTSASHSSAGRLLGPHRTPGWVAGILPLRDLVRSRPRGFRPIRLLQLRCCVQGQKKCLVSAHLLAVSLAAVTWPNTSSPTPAVFAL